MASRREKLQSAAEAFCDAFSQNKDIDTILGHFSSQADVCAVEYGLPKLAPFLGQHFVGKDGVRAYFESLGALLSYSDIQFSEYVVDAESLKVSVKGTGRFKWKSTGIEWDEVFTYTLDFDDAFKLILRVQGSPVTVAQRNVTARAPSTRPVTSTITSKRSHTSSAPPSTTVSSMPLQAEHSVVADSAASDQMSPRMEPQSTPVIKRAARTYGRRTTVPQQDEDSSPMTGIDSSVSEYIHNTAPPGLREEVPPSSPQHSDDDSGDSSLPAGTAQFTYDWKAKLKAIDEGDFSAVSANENATDTSLSFSFGSSSLSNPPPSTAPSEGTLDAADEDNFFQSSPASKRTSDDESPGRPFALPPPRVSTGGRRSRRAYVPDSDGEGPTSTPESSKLFQSLGASSSTQLTSDDEHPLSSKPSKSKLVKGRSKTRSPVSDLGDQSSDDAAESKSAITKRKKNKAPTAKDRQETVKERGRIAASREVHVASTTNSNKYSIVGLFSRLSKATAAASTTVPASDPIETFPSSPAGEELAESPQVPSKENTKPLSDDESSDGEMPSVGDVMKTVDLQKQKQKLLAVKRAAVQRRPSNTLHDDEDEDDDLEVATSAGHKPSKATTSDGAPRVSESRKRQNMLAKIGPTTKSRTATMIMHGKQELSALLKPGVQLSPAELNQLLAAGARVDAEHAKREKEEVWTKHGGRLRQVVAQPVGDLNTVVKVIAEHGTKVAEHRQKVRDAADEEDQEDESDEDWRPELRGSASPEPDNTEDQENEMDDNEMQEGESDEEDDKENVRQPLVKSRKVVQLSDDEEENDENAPVRQAPSRMRHESIVSSEDENKENDTNLMFDSGEDKENTAVVRYGLSMSPENSRRVASLTRRPMEESADDRRPFKVLLDEDDLPPMSSTSGLTQSFADKLKQASPLASTLPSPSLRPLLGNDTPTLGFTQFSPTQAVPKLLGPGFGDLFDGATQKGPSLLMASPSIKESSKPMFMGAGLRRDDLAVSLGLTQDVQESGGLRAPFDEEVEKARAVFEKDQAMVVVAAAKQPDSQQAKQMFINDLGFLTQTRPERSPDVYRINRPTQSTTTSPTPTRAPLRTLSLTISEGPDGFEDSPGRAPRRRLRKQSSTPPPPSLLGAAFTPEPKPKKRNAFDVLGKVSPPKRDKQREKLVASEFFEDEAAESDEDAGFGFAKPKEAAEEDGEDLDRNLETLVDDQVMDEETVAADLVQQKFMEHQEEDDQEVERLHQLAVQGELRKKRKGGIGVDDSDEESDGEEYDSARRAMKRMRTSVRTDIKHLAANEATAAFANTYNQSLKDDDQEFAYLNDESRIDDIVVDKRPEDEMEEEEDESMDEGEDRRYFSFSEIKQQVQDLPKIPSMDPSDVSWLDRDEDDSEPMVKTIIKAKALPQRDALDEGLGLPFGKDVQMTEVRKSWLVHETKSRNAGTSRSVGGSAVTGHTKPKIRTREGPSSRTVPGAGGSRGVKPAQSMLGVMNSRTDKFS